MLRKLLFVSATTVMVSACSQSPEQAAPTALSVVKGNGVSAERVDGGIRVTNNTSAKIAYIVWDLGFLGLLGPCDRPEMTCPMLAASERATVKYGSDGLTGNDDVTVYTWGPLGVPGTPVVQYTLVLLGRNTSNRPRSPTDTTARPPTP